MRAKHLSTWFCFTALATLACGGRTMETGGETSFLACESDADCATACVDGRCAPSDANVVGTPANAAATNTGETTSSQQPGASSSATNEGTTTTFTDGSIDTTTTDIGGTTSTDVRGGTTTTDVGGTTTTDVGSTTSTDVRGGTTSVDGVDGGVDTPRYELLDSMEEPANDVSSSFFWSRAIGNWFTSDAGDSVRVELDPPRGESHYAYWAGGDPAMLDMYAQLKHPEGSEVDLSQYLGFSFWARGTGAGLGLHVAVNAFVPFSDGEVSAVPQKLIRLTDEWQQFDVTFDELGSGTSISTIDFLVDGRTSAFDFWVDDLSLICNQVCPSR